MDLNTLFIVNYAFRHGASLSQIANQLHLNGEDQTEAALFLCDAFGVDAVYPIKRSWRKRQLALT